MTYRAVLKETSGRTTIQLLSYIEQWIQNHAKSIVIQNVHLSLNTTCPVVIPDLDSPECPMTINVRSTSPPQTDPLDHHGDIGGIIGGVVAGVVVLVAVVVTVIMITLLVLRRHKQLRFMIRYIGSIVQNNRL